MIALLKSLVHQVMHRANGSLMVSNRSKLLSIQSHGSVQSASSNRDQPSRSTRLREDSADSVNEYQKQSIENARRADSNSYSGYYSVACPNVEHCSSSSSQSTRSSSSSSSRSCSPHSVSDYSSDASSSCDSSSSYSSND